MVPHWYEAKAGRIRHELTVRSIGDPPIPIRLPYWTTRDFGEVDKDLHSIMSEVAAQVMADMGRRKRADFSRLDLEVFAQSVVLEWLIDRDPSVEWVKLLDYAHMLRERTYENDPVVFNAILDATAERGSIDITSEEEGVQKKIDPLATSLNTLFVLDKTDTRIVSYEQIPLTRDDKRSHFAHPSVLAPITSGLNSGDFSFHRMRRGDVLITDSAGLVVTRRKGQWYVYEGCA